MKTLLLLVMMVAASLFCNADTWTKKANFPGFQTSAVGFSINGKGYVGTGGSSKYLWEYDPTTDTWAQKADFGGVGRDYAAGFSIGSKGYIGTGRISLTNNGFVTDFWEYDQVTNAWVQKMTFPSGKRQGAFGFSIGQKGYIGGGENTFVQKNDFWEYDPATDAWTQKANYGGGGKSFTAGFVIDSKAYVGTGYVFGSEYFKDFWEYDPITNIWTQKADFAGSERAAAVGFSVGSLGYLGMGGDQNDFYFGDFWQYDPATDSWTQISNYPGDSGQFASSFTIDSKGYIGLGGHGLKELWQYTPDCVGITVYADADADGYGDINSSFFAGNCIIPSGYVTDSSDCNDANASINPGVTEVCSNGIDDNCNGQVDENCCSIPTGLVTTNLTSTTAQLNWNTVATATKYKVQWKLSTAASWNVITVNAPTTTTTLTGLTANTKYKWKVKSVCGAGVYSDFSPIVKFTTLLRLGNQLATQNIVSVYPNPASNNISIEITLEQEQSLTIKLTDVIGREVYSSYEGNISGTFTKQLNLSHLASGTYFLKVMHGGVSEMRKMVVEK